MTKLDTSFETRETCLNPSLASPMPQVALTALDPFSGHLTEYSPLPVPKMLTSAPRRLVGSFPDIA